MSVSAAATRKRLTPAKEKIIAAAQDYKCAMCRVVLPSTWELDHKIELWQGGTNDLDNFQVLCPNCHRKKTQLAAIAREDAKRGSAGTPPTDVTSPHFQVDPAAVPNPKPIPPYIKRRQNQNRRQWGSFFCCSSDIEATPRDDD